MWKKKIIQGLWIAAGVAVIVLLGAAMQQKNHKACLDVKIDITGAETHMFIDENDVLEILNSNGTMKGKNIAAVNLRSLEEQLEKNAWVKNAELFFDNNQVLMVSIEERQPVARVFTVQGTSFYLDTACNKLPLSEKLSARVPVFTSFPNNKEVMAHSDSLLMKDVVKVANYIMADSFWMAQVAQVDITPNGNFELSPVIGNHIVAIGNAEDLEGKFNRLFTFYKQAWLQNGMNKYERLDVQYNNQIVAVKKGTAKMIVDSAKAAQVVNELMNSNHTDTAQHISVAAVNNMVTRRDSARTTRAVTNPPKPAAAQSANRNNSNRQQAARPANNVRLQLPKPNPPKPEANRPRAVMGNRN